MKHKLKTFGLVVIKTKPISGRLGRNSRRRISRHFYVLFYIMTTLRPFRCEDMFSFNNVNLDPLTETYGLSFYLQYLAHWPEYFQVAESPSGVIMGYSKCDYIKYLVFDMSWNWVQFC